MADKGDILADLEATLARAGACKDHPPLRVSRTREEAAKWRNVVKNCAPAARRKHIRWLTQNDLFFLLVYILGIKALDHQWGFKSCALVQADAENKLFFWSRGAFKSAIITHGKTIQDLLIDPNQTFCLLSHTRPNAKKFLVPIKQVFETNAVLKEAFPDVLWDRPKVEAPKWGEDAGLTLKRITTVKESSVEAWGLIDGQPTGEHFTWLVYDDVIPDFPTEGMIQRCTEQWELSLSLTARPLRYRVVGTFYAPNDTYRVMMDRGFGGTPCIRCMVTDPDCPMTSEEIAAQKQSVSPKTWATQYLLDFAAATAESGFRREWLEYYREVPDRKATNMYVVVDPAAAETIHGSRTAMWVFGLFADKRCYIYDCVWDQMDLIQRTRAFLDLVEKWQPTLVQGYEKYSMQADIQHIKEAAAREGTKLNIVEVGGTRLSKEQRIERLMPMFQQHRIVFPERGIYRKLKDGREVDLVGQFIDREYASYPFVQGNSPDMLDALARLFDLNLSWPKAYGKASEMAHPFGAGGGESAGGSWMSS